MKKETIYELKSLYRDDFRIQSFDFGQGYPSICIVGALRGNEIQQVYICSLLIEKLKELESRNLIAKDYKISVIPSANPYSMNGASRFWPADDTDINRMFPGYDKGETTQRIAQGLFDVLQTYEYGVQLTSFYIPGHFATHVRMMKTGLEDIEEAKHFGLPYIVVRQPRPYDTTTLNYNWQIWNCKAYSLYTNACQDIDEESALEACNAILRFLSEKQIIKTPIYGGHISEVVQENQMVSLKCNEAGFLDNRVSLNAIVKKGDIIAMIRDPYDHSIKEMVRSDVDGQVFFLHAHPFVYAHTAVAKIKLSTI